MKVILLREVERLGKPHDIVDVKSGYARNYLIPKHLAIPATEANVRGLRKSQSRFSQKKEKAKAVSIDLVEQFKDLSIKTTIKTGIEGKSFGSITSHDVALLLKDNDIEIDKKNIILEEPIKHPGVYDIKVHLSEGVNALFKLVVIEEGT